jgi:hypothetical protein
MLRIVLIVMVPGEIFYTVKNVADILLILNNYNESDVALTA